MSDAALAHRPPIAAATAAHPGAAAAAPAPAADSPPLQAVWASRADEVRAAQRLRWQVFADEMGARLRPPPGTPPRHDADRFDPHCEHLLVRTAATADRAPRVVGTYRVLTPAAARLLGGLYTETEFDCRRLAPMRPQLLELGRSCTAPDHRHGAVVLMLWGTLLRFMVDNGLDAAIGCVSIGVRDGGHAAASIWRQLARDHAAPAALQVRPRLPLPLQHLRQDLPVELPPLLRGYLRCGAQLLGEPAWDADFGVADLPMLLRLSDLPGPYRNRLLRR